jgi:hypothetical protein
MQIPPYPLQIVEMEPRRSMAITPVAISVVARKPVIASEATEVDLEIFVFGNDGDDEYS